MPGQDAEEIALSAVPDNAIQIVDDEPQGVPTEEEVGAMLAATAGVILSSGLGQVVEDDEAVEDVTAADTNDDAGDEDDIVLDVDMSGSVSIVAVAVESPEAGHPPIAEEQAAVVLEFRQVIVVAARLHLQMLGRVAIAESDGGVIVLHHRYLAEPLP